jgi:ubiquinone/menaquinone biosynthesis C-methylase UbiE
MIEPILDCLRCPECMNPRLDVSAAEVKCRQCSARYPFRNGILDWLGAGASEVITPFQRVMQTPLIVSIYEGMWRRLGYWIASSRSFDREMETILKMQRSAPAGRSLDLACGTGVFTRPLARNTRGVFVGFDLSWPMLREAQRRLKRDGLANVVLMRGTAFRLPFVDGAFQHVNCCGALHLFDQPDPALREIRRVLHNTGRLSVQTTIRPEHSGGTAYFLERFIRFGFFTEGDLRERVRRHGFKILESERHRISYSFLAGVADR